MGATGAFCGKDINPKDLGLVGGAEAALRGKTPTLRGASCGIDTGHVTIGVNNMEYFFY